MIPYQHTLKKILHVLIKNKYKLAVFLILLIAAYFRFSNYPNRWGLGSDQARDAIVIKNAIQSHAFPLIGPFSASGPFVFGSSWYLFFILLTYVVPHYILAPWILQSILFVLITLVMVSIGTTIGGKKFSLILGLFTAVSPAQIIASTNLIYSSFEIIISTLVLFLFLYSLKKSTSLSYFFLGLSVGIAITIHFQAIPLIVLFPVCIIFSRANVKKILIMMSGFLIPFIPLGIFDVRSNFFESTHLINYFFSRQAAQPSTRWLKYLFSFWPAIWSDTIGGFSITGYVLMLLLIIIAAYCYRKKMFDKMILGCLISFSVSVIALRYFSGDLFESFLSFLQPFILLLTAWICMKIISINKYIGIILISIIVIGSCVVNIETIFTATNNTAKETALLQIYLEQARPHQKFAVYDHSHENTAISLPLSLFLYSKDEIKDTGFPIGIASQQLHNTQILYEIKTPYHIFIYNLSSYKKLDLQKNNWISVNPSAVYHSVEDWYER